MDSLFLEIDNIIKKKLNIENETSTDLYKDPSYRKQCSEIISEIVNTYIPKVEPIHDIFLEEKLKENGCVILENFINESEVDEIIDLIKLKPGYNYHIAASSYNQETKIFSENIDWNILSYKPEVFLKSDLILKKIADRSLLSLVQSYLQCFPTFYSVNCVWFKHTNEPFKTQKVHRDFDDFKFLSLFITLTDIDDNNGPHVYYPKTFDGSDIVEKPLIIKGKKGTCFLADTYGLHHGLELKEKSRCLLWLRFGMYVNNVHFKDKNNLFKQDENYLFDIVEKNLHNQYLFRAFIKSQND